MTKLLFIFLGFNTFAATDTLHLDSKTEQVTVFKKGAVVTRVMDLRAINEETHISIDKLSLAIDRNSIELVPNENLEIVSVKHETYIDSSSNYNQEIKDIVLDRNRVQDSIDLYRRFLEVLEIEKELFEDNNDFSSKEDGVDIDKLEKAARLYRTRLRQIELDIFKVSKDIESFKTDIVKMNQAVYRIQENNQDEYLSVKVLVRPLKPGSHTLKLKYYTHEAGWTPYYDARVYDEDHENLRLDLKANVFQTTGETWENVQLSLTNSDPRKKQTPPALNPVFLDAHVNYYKTEPVELISDKEIGIGRGVIMDERGERLIGASIVIKNTAIGTITDIDGEFNLPEAVGKIIEVSYTGYVSKELYFAGDGRVIQLEEGVTLDEVVVTGLGQELAGNSTGISIRGSRLKNVGYYVDGIRVRQERKAVNVEISESITSVFYKLEGNYTINSTVETSEVLLEQKDLPVKYYYLVVPRLSKDAYLIASIENWEDYDLLSAPVNIYHNQIFKGKSTIDPAQIDEKMELSIGVDSEVVVNREQIKDYTKKQFLKSKISEEMAWEIAIRNAKEKSIRVRVNDQIPVSNDKSIDVDLLESGSADLDEKRGILTWDIHLSKGDTFKENLIYKVKYPKDQKLVLI